jgi:regulation of enolase protein 1 (concanavalin A-like superfamily)
MRICRLNIGAKKLFAGIYGCSPVGGGFEFTVSNLDFTIA